MVQIFFLAALALLLLALVVIQRLSRTQPEQLLRFVRIAGLTVLGVVLLILAARGRLQTALLLAPAVLPLLMRWRALMNRSKAAAGPQSGQHSDIETAYLRMRLDHDTGEMSGEVLAGRYSGRPLEELQLEELVQLWQECQANDPQSATVLEAYLDRLHGDTWRDAAAQAGSAQGGGNGPMTREEAYSILGVERNASSEEIKAAHRRLMQKIHPDHGGSTYLAAKINQAKDLLLNT